MTFLLLLLTLQAERLVFWAEGAAYAETIEIIDYTVRLSTIPNGDKEVWMEIFVWDKKFGKLVNWTVVVGRADAITRCAPPGKPLPPLDNACCDAAHQAREWLREQLWLPRVRVTATSANIMETPSIHAPTITTVQHETVLRKVGQERQRQWIKVILDNSGEIGWIYGELVE